MLKIITEKIVVRGEKARKIIKIEGCLENDKLPQEYLDYYPKLVNWSVSELPMQWRILINNKAPTYIREGDLLYEFYYQEILANIKECSNRLHLINEKLKKETEGWTGGETIII